MEYMRDENGEVYGFIYDGGTYFLEKNALGDVKYLLNGNGGVLAKYTYDEWGKVIGVTDANGNEITDKANVAHLNPFRYRSYYYDWETGFYYLKSRYYDPSLCRFVNADSEIADVGESVTGYNLFAYCFNNPVNMDDPSGNWPTWGRIFTAVAGIAIVTVAVAAIVTTGPILAAAIAVGYTSAVIAASATIACATVAGVCGASLIGEAITEKNPLRDSLGSDNFDYITSLSTLGTIQGMSTLSSFSTSTSYTPRNNSKLEKYIDNPEKIKNVPVSSIEKIATREGLCTGTLTRGSHVGQGFKVTWGGDRLIQFHPGGGHHGEFSYWKISSGDSGTVRIFNDK